MNKKTLVLLALTLASTFSIAQVQFGRISGKVFDRENSNGLSAVTVYLFQGEVQKQSARTNSSGNFSFVNVAPDGYTIKTSKNGYEEYNKLVRVNPNFTTKLNIPLVPLNSNSEIVAENKTVEEAKPIQVVKPEPKSPIVSKTDNKESQLSGSSATTPTVSTTPVLTNVDKKTTQTDQATPSKPLAEAEVVQEEIKSDELVFVEAPQEMPEPVDGWKSLYGKIKYPEIARKQKAQGTVVLSVYIDKNGDVISIEILKSAHPSLDKAAEDAVYETHFKPGLQEGKPIETKIPIRVPFKI